MGAYGSRYEAIVGIGIELFQLLMTAYVDGGEIMTQKDQEWMEQYIYQVVRRLPKEQREEVSMELRELISDMLEQSGSSESDCSMEKVLSELGDPAEFAKRYRDDAHCLIGPEYYDTYLWFMKIVLLCTLISTFVMSLLEGIHHVVGSEGEGYVGIVVRTFVSCFVNGITNCAISCISVFGGITIVFAVLERQVKKNGLRDGLGKKVWTPGELTSIPHKKAMIDRGDCIVGIVFIVIFCMLLIMSPNAFSAIVRSGANDKDVTLVPILNLMQWNRILPLFVIGLLVGLADEVFKLIVGIYCYKVMISCIISGFIQIILGSVILKVLPFWNPDFMIQMELQAMKGNTGAEFIKEWLSGGNVSIMSNVILAFIILCTLEEIGVTVYKTIRYGEKYSFL